mmetsp:Transcript_18010/g.30668  ORF Transcript_18010/g.30668 Transcript_18010/m.30668 type:complete len:90 (-) Transcript_18010:370-639(-)
MVLQPSNSKELKKEDSQIIGRGSICSDEPPRKKYSQQHIEQEDEAIEKPEAYGQFSQEANEESAQLEQPNSDRESQSNFPIGPSPSFLP